MLDDLAVFDDILDIVNIYSSLLHSSLGMGQNLGRTLVPELFDPLMNSPVITWV